MTARNAKEEFSLGGGRSAAGGSVCYIRERQINPRENIIVIVSNLTANRAGLDGRRRRSLIVRWAPTQMSNANANAIAAAPTIRDAQEYIANITEVVIESHDDGAQPLLMWYGSNILNRQVVMLMSGVLGVSRNQRKVLTRL